MYVISSRSYFVVFLIIRELQAAHPKFTQTSYDGHTLAGGTFTHLQYHMYEIMAWGPQRGVFTRLTKIILVISMCNIEHVQRFLLVRELKIVTER